MELEYSYLAGLVDGEGYLGITTKGIRVNGRNKYQVIIRIQMCDKEIIEYLSSFLNVKIANHYRDHPIWKDAYSVTLYDNRATEFIKKIYPYLRVKKKQAEIIIEFRKSITRGRNQSNPVTLEMIDKQDELYNKIRFINTRGKHGWKPTKNK